MAYKPNAFRPDPKPERVLKQKKRYKFIKKATGEKEVFKMIWDERPHRSQISGKVISEATPTNFLHVLPKAKNKYPEFKLLKQNIVLGTAEEHRLWDEERESIRDNPKWQWVFELEETLKDKYKGNYGSEE